MAIQSVTRLLAFCFAQQLYISVQGAVIWKWYDMPVINDPKEVAPAELDDSMPRVLSPSMTADDGLAPLLSPSSPQFIPTQTSVKQYIEYPSSSTTTTCDQPITITPPPVAPDFTIAESVAQTECIPWAWGCLIYYKYVNLHYLPVKGHNTDCLTDFSQDISTAANPLNGPILSQWQASSVAIVITSIIARKGCRTIGNTYADLTHTFDLKDLATIRENDPSHYAFNLMDFPCPPASVSYMKPLPYQPMVLPPMWYLTNLDDAWHTCTPAWGQGTDPPYAAPTAADGASDQKAEGILFPPGG